MRCGNQKGLTLVELLISITIGLGILAAASTFYVTTAVSSVSSMASSRLNHELTTLMSVMVQDIRRAGYSGHDDVKTDPLSNDFNTVDETVLTIRPSSANPASAATSGQCILYAYDADSDEDLGNLDILGFRLNNGVVQMRQQGDVAANARHDHCNDGDDTWLDITDGNLISITGLTFDSNPGVASQCLNVREPDDVDNDGDGTIDNDEEADCYDAPLPTNGSGDITVETREILITLAGELANDDFVKVEIEKTVRVRNDLVRER